MELKDFYNLHSGQTCLLVGLGPNLHHTPPEKFDYPSIGLNTIYKYKGWKPTYFAGVDERLEREDGPAICELYRDIPKFIPTPDRDSWKGENFHRFYHRPGEITAGGRSPRHPDALTREGIAYVNVMTAAMQIAWHMGFTTMLIIGMQHKPDALHEHFWGEDDKKTLKQTTEHWLIGYASLVRAMSNVKVLNISENTYVKEDVIPRDDFRKYLKGDDMRVQMLEYAQGSEISGDDVAAGITVKVLEPEKVYEVSASLGAWLVEHKKAVETTANARPYKGKPEPKPEVKTEVKSEPKVEPEPVMTTQNQATGKKDKGK